MSNQIATTILNQIGGKGRVSSMIGARDFVAIEQGLRFKFTARARNRINCVDIRLDASDTYDVTFARVWSFGSECIRSNRGVHADQLRAVIEQATGLALSL